MTGLLVVGAGGHGKVVAEAALETGVWDQVAFLDDDQTIALSGVPGCEILGVTSAAVTHLQAFASLVVTVGDNRRRLELLSAYKRQGFELPVIVHPQAAVSRSATLGSGTVVLAQAAINAQASLGVGCIVNTSSSVDHDCVLGNGVHVSPGAHLGGGVTVGHCAWIGIGACVKHAVRLGEDAIVGAGSAVMRNVPDRTTVIGVPASALIRDG